MLVKQPLKKVDKLHWILMFHIIAVESEVFILIYVPLVYAKFTNIFLTEHLASPKLFLDCFR